jgi:hypothetical protein
LLANLFDSPQRVARALERMGKLGMRRNGWEYRATDVCLNRIPAPLPIEIYQLDYQMQVVRIIGYIDRYRYFLQDKKTSKYKIVFGVVIFFISLVATAIAGDFDGSKPLSGVTGKIIEINQYKIIDNVDPDTVGLPKKFLIDFSSKTLRPSKDSLVRRTITFKSLKHIENKMVMQGVDEGVEGVDDGLAYVVFGICKPIKDNQ